MTTALYYHPLCLEHVTGDDHPEHPDRLRAVLAALEGLDDIAVDRRLAARATPEQIAAVHGQAYIDDIRTQAPAQGLRDLGDGTMVSAHSIDAAYHAAGAVCQAVDAVVATDVRTAFCAVRPPGHHAEPDRAMGFCLFNNVVIGARHARRAHGIRRIAIVDFDVHHGNGTQALVDADPDLMLVSVHQHPFYPGTGRPDDTGPHGNIVNIALRAGSGSPEFRQAVTLRLHRAIDGFAPDLIMISAGFDAHWRDPLAHINLVEDDYRWVTRKLVDLARVHCGGRIVSTLEGGYHPMALAASCVAHVRALSVP